MLLPDELAVLVKGSTRHGDMHALETCHYSDTRLDVSKLWWRLQACGSGIRCPVHPHVVYRRKHKGSKAIPKSPHNRIDGICRAVLCQYTLLHLVQERHVIGTGNNVGEITMLWTHKRRFNFSVAVKQRDKALTIEWK